MSGIEGENGVCLAAVGHDPEGRWADHLVESNNLLTELYTSRLIYLSERTHNSTIDAAIALGWRVDVEDLPVGSARFAVVRKGLEITNKYINLWDGDRLLHAAKRAPEELRDITGRIPRYDCFIAGATPEAILTHQSSMTVWEGVKSRVLGERIGIRGDIANRGCFGFSPEFARFLIMHEDAKGDEVVALFAILPLAFRSLINLGQLPKTGRETIGYAEYNVATSYEDADFYPERTAQSKDTYQDFMYRAETVIRTIGLADRIGEMYNLGFPEEGQRIRDVVTILAQQL